MNATKKSFCIVCLANFCRSPVAEILLKERFKDKYEFYSAGISPVALPNMDPRSLEFLKEGKIEHDFHNPKKINKNMLDYFDKFLAVDFFILNQLNLNYPKYKNKFCLITSQFDEVNLFDPYQLEIKEYRKVMDDIHYVTQNIDLEKL